jgi:hypothetical protein
VPPMFALRRTQRARAHRSVPLRELLVHVLASARALM